MTKSLKTKSKWSLFPCHYRSKVKEVERATAQISTCKESINKVAVDKLAFKQEKSNIEAQLQQIEHVNEDRSQKLKSLRKEMRQFQEESKRLQKALDEREKEKSEKSSQLDSMKETITKLRGSGTKEQEETREKRAMKIGAMEKDLAALEAKLQSTQTHLGNLKHTLDSANNEGREIEAEVQSAKNNVIALKRQMKQIKDQGENRLVLFGENIPRIVADIQRNRGKFRNFPIGPLGMEIQLKPNVSKQKAALIEHEIGGLLNAFIVDNFNVRHVFFFSKNIE